MLLRRTTSHSAPALGVGGIAKHPWMLGLLLHHAVCAAQPAASLSPRVFALNTQGGAYNFFLKGQHLYKCYYRYFVLGRGAWQAQWDGAVQMSKGKW